MLLIARIAVAALCWLACLHAIGASRCPPEPTALSQEEARVARRNAQDRGILYRLERDGRSSWLYGTLHVGRREWIYPGPTLQQALSQSDVLALELDVLDPSVPQRLDARLAAAGPPPALSPKLRSRLAAVAAGLCLPMTSLRHARPEMQLMAVMMRAGRADGLDAAYGSELMLAGYARAARKAIDGLESPEAQAEAILMPDRDLAGMLDQGLADLEKGTARAMLGRMAEVWAKGRMDELSRYAQWCQCLDTVEAREWHERLLDRRNPGLADGVERLHASGQRVFAAVGSLHLIGATGLPSLLKARGFTVKRVPFP